MSNAIVELIATSAVPKTSEALISLLSTAPPAVTDEQAHTVVKESYGFDTLISSLSGERDRNFLVSSQATGARAVLKARPLKCPVTEG